MSLTTVDAASDTEVDVTSIATVRTDLEAKFKDHFRSVRFSTSIFEGKKNVKGVTAVVDGGDKLDEERVTHPRVALLPRDMAREANHARQRIYGVLDRFTLPTQVKGSRLVAATNAETFVREFNDAKAEFYRVADAIAASHGSNIEHNRSYWLPKFNFDEVQYEERIGSLIKSAVEIRNAFQVTFSLDDSSGSTASNRYADSAVNQFFQDAANQHAAEVRESVKAATEQPVRRLAAAIDAMRSRLTTDNAKSPLRVDSFSELKNALSLCETCAVMLDATTADQVRSASRFIDNLVATARVTSTGGGSASDVIRRSSSELSQIFDATVQSCQNHLESAAIQSTFGMPRRGRRYA
jgi:hypothetical protein